MKHINAISTKESISSNIYWYLWRRFYPLAITDFAMTLGDTLRPIALSRLPYTEISLAAIGIVKSIAIFLESPLIMIFHASTALSKDKESHKALWQFTLLTLGIITSIFLIICFQPIYDWLLLNVFHLSFSIAKMAHIAFVMMVPWPALIVIRRFFQGLLVRYHKEKSLANAGMIRLIFTVFLLWLGVYFKLNGIVVAALSLVGAVSIEAAVIIYFAKKISLVIDEKTNLPKNIKAVARYYTPLGFSTMVIWAARALIIAIIARASDGILGIAIWTAISGFVLPIANATRMVQQIVISSSKDISHKILLKFGFIIGAIFCVPIILLSLTNTGIQMLNILLGGKSNIITPSISALRIFISLPLLTAIQNTLQGFHMISNSLWWINFSTIINTVSCIIITILMINLNFSGEISAATAMIMGLIIEIFMLSLKKVTS